MSDGLKTILDQLQEKVDKANQDAERIISEAKAKAAEVEAEAHAQAQEKARIADEEIKRMQEVHAQKLQQATRDTLIALKEQTRHMVLNRAVDEVVIDHIRDPEFVRQAILSMCTEFANQSEKNSDLKVLLGEGTFQRIGRELQKAAHEQIEKKLSVGKLEGIRGGFQIGVVGKSYVYDFSDEALAELFSVAYGAEIDAQLFAGTEKDG